MIAAEEVQSALVQQENLAMTNTLTIANIRIPISLAATAKIPENYNNVSKPLKLQHEASPRYFNSSVSPQQSKASPTNSLVSINYDELIDASCLHVGPASSFDIATDITMNSPDIFNFPNNAFTAPPLPANPIPPANFSRPSPASSKAQYNVQNQVPPLLSTTTDLSTIAINFVLAFVTLSM